MEHNSVCVHVHTTLLLLLLLLRRFNHVRPCATP